MNEWVATTNSPEYGTSIPPSGYFAYNLMYRPSEDASVNQYMKY